MRDSPLLPLLATLATVAPLVILLGILVARRRKAEEPSGTLARLESQGLLLRQRFRANRAFGVDELEDEGSHYVIELEDRSVLFLSGQYLYEVEARESRRKPRVRRFPNTEFEILRHGKELYVLDILCSGEVIEPELFAPPFSIEEYQRCEVPGDGEILTGTSYEALKHAAELGTLTQACTHALSTY